MQKAYSISPINERATLVSFGNVIDESVNRKVISLHQSLNRMPFEGFIESVPAYASLAIFYNPIEIFRNNSRIKSAFDFVETFLEDMLKQSRADIEEELIRTIEIPVLYNGEDLEFVANQHRLTKNEVVAIHTSQKYRVFMIGFLPGFPYMGVLDKRITTPRKSTPRTNVPSGSVGVAGFQTGIYPQASPGGWQLIGRTPLKIFNAEKSNACILNPGDSVKFYSIDQNEFDKLNEY